MYKITSLINNSLWAETEIP